MRKPENPNAGIRRPYVNKDLEELGGGVRALTAVFFLATLFFVLFTGFWGVSLVLEPPQLDWGLGFGGGRALLPGALAAACSALGTWGAYQSEKSASSRGAYRYGLLCVFAGAGAVVAGGTMVMAIGQSLL